MKNVLHTELCDILGIEYPIILAGMGNVCGPSLAAAVSNAGGLGVLGASPLMPEEITEWIRKTRTLTDKPFGVDLLMPAIVENTEAQEVSIKIPDEQADFVERLRVELGVPKDTKGMDWPMNADFAQRQLQAVLDEHPPVFATGLGTPEWVVPKVKECGIKAISIVGNVKNAVRVNARGADIIVAQGHEAGGHTGRIGTLALVPQVVDAVSPTPVVAAGGIADGRGLAAALTLGAVGAWVGTAFLATPEAGVDVYGMGFFSEEFMKYWKDNILKMTEEDTLVSRVYTGKTARAIKGEFAKMWEKSGVSYLPMPLQFLATTDLIDGLGKQGKFEYLPKFTGQAAGMIKEIKSPEQIIKEMVEEATKILGGK